jgi:hypothetical protein
MHKLRLTPNVSVGPFVFGTEQQEMWEIMKNEFGSVRSSIVERNKPSYESEYYANPDIHLDYKDNKLISVNFIDDIRQRYCEIYLEDQKIWPRTERKFLAIFGRDSFIEIYGTYYHTRFSLAVGWDDNPPSLLIGQEGYCTEAVEHFRFYNIVSKMEKGLPRDVCRMTINRAYHVSEDGRSDNYQHGVIKREATSLTFDSDNRLIKAWQSYPDGDVIDILD